MDPTLLSAVAAPKGLAPKDSLVGTRLNGFVITGTVSVGGMGVVYEALHPLIGRRAAVKVIRPELCNDIDLAARFLREAQAVSAVRHRNVVEILDFGALPDGAQYMMMEFLEGDTLAEVIARQAPMRPLEVLHICEEILCGLSAAHQVGVVHRDLKPANIVLMKQSDGELIVKVLDFGLARHLDTAPEPTTRESLRAMSLEKSSLLAGTPEYISPEQASGAQVGAQGDLYCLGVILFEMLTGRLLFNSTSPWELIQLHRLVEPPPLSAFAPGVHPQLADLVMRLLKKDPAERPLGAKEAAREVAELRQLIHSARLPDTFVIDRARQPKPVRRWRFSKARVGAGAGAAVVLGLLGVGFALGGASPPPVASAAVPEPAVEVVPVPPTALPPAPVAPPEPAAPGLAAIAAVAVKPRARAPASSSCDSSPAWKRGVREQLEDLEKLSLARTRDDAPPSEIATIRQKARGLATALRDARGAQCQRVEADVRAWRMALR